MMLIAQATYKNSGTFQTARIRIVKRPSNYLITAHIGGEDDGAIPAWVQTAITEEQARMVGNRLHQALKHHYSMQRIT